jgi:hypothetical protein
MTRFSTYRSTTVAEVSNYVEFPLSLRLIREMHAFLLHSGRGAS